MKTDKFLTALRATGLRVEVLTNDDNEDIECVTGANGEHITYNELKTFAKLIVKECARRIDPNYEKDYVVRDTEKHPHTLEELAWRIADKDTILQHFGIDE